MTVDPQTKRRIFTAEQEQLMQRQSLGEFSMHRLERLTKASRETLIPRMIELGFPPRIILHVRRCNPYPEHWAPGDSFDSAPSVIRSLVRGDELLNRLNECHPDRRYG